MLNSNAHILQQQQQQIQRTLDQFVDIMGVEARNHFVKSFKDQGFTDQTIEKWEPRKDEVATTGGIDFRRSRTGFIDSNATNRAILVKTGDLRRSIRIVAKTADSVTIGTDLPYAQIHNEGGKGMAFGRYEFDMPKRQFMGDSQKLIEKLKLMLQKKIKQIFR